MGESEYASKIGIDTIWGNQYPCTWIKGALDVPQIHGYIFMFIIFRGAGS